MLIKWPRWPIKADFLSITAYFIKRLEFVALSRKNGKLKSEKRTAKKGINICVLKIAVKGNVAIAYINLQ